MRTKDFHRASGSQYGTRVGDLEDVKKKIGQAVVSRVLWPSGMAPKNPIYISDGSSTSYVWCYYLREWVAKAKEAEPLKIWTNNVDIPLQVLCEPGAPGRVNIQVAPGAFSFKYCANFGPETEAWLREHCGRSTCLLAVTALDAELGPCSKDPAAREVKRAVMERANVLVVVADHTKLGHKRDPSDAASPDEWKKWRDVRAREGRLFVVTDLSPGVSLPYRRCPFTKFPDTRTADQIENENVWGLSTTLGGQFIVVH